MMLAQCSHCKKTYPLRGENAQTFSAIASCCPKCEKKLAKLPSFIANESVVNSSSHTLAWSAAFMTSVFLLGFQAYWVAYHVASQNPEQRVILEKVCRPQWRCFLPDYQNLEEFEIMHRDFQPIDKHYVFQAVLSNQAEFAQPYPRIKLSLLDFQGQAFAERIFYPRDYLPTKTPRLMPASETLEMSLNIASPPQTVGGYTFDLM